MKMLWFGVVPALLLVPGVSLAQTKAPAQVVKPPIAQAWIDVATFTGFGMPAGGNPMGAIAGMFGGGGRGDNQFGHTQMSSAGRWFDVTLFTRNNANLTEGTQAVPAGSQLAPTLKLVSPEQARPSPTTRDDDVVEQEFERPKGKIYVYWGCSETVRPGQPAVLDLATATPAEMARIFQSRRATQRGAHTAAGRPQWPNRVDRRMVPDGASLIGEHAFGGQGVPDGFKFNLPVAQDIMPAIELKQNERNGAYVLQWKSVPHARAYFASVMGAKGGGGGDQVEMVFWSSSELLDIGMGLVDYQTNPAIDRWLKEKVVLDPATTQCAVPAGIFGEAGMLKMIAYGNELNLVHPPRPSDPKQPWEQEWAVKVRVKSVHQGMLGMEMPAAPAAQGSRKKAIVEEDSKTEEKEEAAAKKDESKLPGAVDILRGIFRR